MKGNVVLKSLLFLTVLTVGYSNISTKDPENCYKYLFFQSFDIASDAVYGIQQALKQKHKPYFIKRSYDIFGDEVSVTTKSYYSQYRKKPTYKKEIFKANTFYLLDNKRAKIEFVYKSSDKNHLTQINKKVKNCNFKSKKIAFNTNSAGMVKIL